MIPGKKKDLSDSAIAREVDSEASQVSDVPDEQTKAGLKKDDREKEKAKTAGVRADEAQAALLLSSEETVRYLKQQVTWNRERVLALQAQVDDFASQREELGKLREQSSTQKCLLGCCAFIGALGGVTMTLSKSVCSEWQKIVFGAGLAMVLTGAVFSFALTIRS